MSECRPTAFSESSVIAWSWIKSKREERSLNIHFPSRGDGCRVCGLVSMTVATEAVGQSSPAWLHPVVDSCPPSPLSSPLLSCKGGHEKSYTCIASWIPHSLSHRGCVKSSWTFPIITVDVWGERSSSEQNTRHRKMTTVTKPKEKKKRISSF